jgi:hypothetical protein
VKCNIFLKKNKLWFIATVLGLDHSVRYIYWCIRALVVSICHKSGGRLVSAVQAAQPTVADQSAAFGLSNCSRTMTAALADLCAAVGHVQDTAAAQPSKSGVETAVEQIEAMQAELGQVRQAHNAGRLVPLPGETMDTCAAELGATSKILGSTMAQLLTAAALVGLIVYVLQDLLICLNKGIRKKRGIFWRFPCDSYNYICQLSVQSILT